MADATWWSVREPGGHRELIARIAAGGSFSIPLHPGHLLPSRRGQTPRRYRARCFASARTSASPAVLKL